MKTAKMLTILVLGLLVWWSKVSKAAPMGSAITYQGRLMDSNLPADDYYEFQFRLYDSPEDGNQLGPMISLRGVDVIDGYFTVLLDFGALVYNGDARWLEIDTKPPGTPDPFITLSPRQELTPIPYARYAPLAGTAIDSIRGGGTSGHVSKFGSGNTIEDSIIYQADNRIGVGTENPQGRLSIQMPSAISPIDVDGLVIRGGLLNNGDYIEVQDFSGNPMLVVRGGRIGIGTTSPDAGLHLKGAGWPDSFVHLEGDDGNDTGIRLYEGKTPKWHIFNSTADNGLRIYNSDGSKTVFFAEQSTGEVGIGTETPQAKLHVEGSARVSDDLSVHGRLMVNDAYVGSFPRPAYISSWVSITPGTNHTFSHYVGGDPDDYFVDVLFKSPDNKINHFYYGGNGSWGAYWWDLDESQVKVFREPNDSYVDKVRVRIWVYK